MIAVVLATVLVADEVVAVRADFADGRVCSRTGWCWELPQPQGAQLSAFWGSSGRDVWAAGSLGTLLHFDGTRWSGRADLIDGTLNALWGAGPRDVWAAGTNGALLHFDGDAWRRVPTGSTQELRALVGASRSDVWAVGGTTALHFDGARWSSVPVPADAGLWFAWFEGKTVFVRGRALFRFDGRAFVEIEKFQPPEPMPVPGPARSKFASQARELLKRAGGKWVPAGVATGEQIERSWFPSASLAWAVTTERGALRYDGKEWTRFPIPEFPTVIWERTPTDAWAGSLFGVPMHFDGKSWSAPTQPCGAYLGGMTVVDDEVWLANSEGLCRRTAAGWERLHVRLEASNAAMAGTAADDVWIASRDGLYRWNGEFLGDARLTPGRVPADAALRVHELWPVSRRSVWAVGDAGLILLWDGERWVTVPSGSSAPLRGVWADGSGSVWVVGGKGAALRWTGTSFAAVPTPPMGRPGRHWLAPDRAVDIAPEARAELWAISGTASDDVWAAGGPEGNQRPHHAYQSEVPPPVDWGTALLHWDGKTWSAVPTGDAVWLDDVWARARDDVWAAGWGALLHFDGKSWSKRVISSTQLERSRTQLGGTRTDLFILRDRGLRRLPLPPPSP